MIDSMLYSTDSAFGFTLRGCADVSCWDVLLCSPPGSPCVCRVQKGLSRPTHQSHLHRRVGSFSDLTLPLHHRPPFGVPPPLPLGRLSARLSSMLATILTYLGRLPMCLNPPLGVPCPSAPVVFQTVYHVSEAALYAVGQPSV